MIRILKFTGLLEGISAILLFFVAMPMKYIFDDKSLIRPIGMAHGVLFTIFVLFAFMVTIEKKWGFKKFIILFVCATIPLGTFYADKKYLKNV